MADFITLVEPFDSIDSKWAVFGTADANGELNIRPGDGATGWNHSVRSVDRWNLPWSGSSGFVVQFVPYSNGGAKMGLLNGSAQGYMLEQISATTYRSIITDGSSLFAAVNHTTTDTYWKFIHASSGDTLEVYSSVDGATWTYRTGMNMTSSNTGFTWKNAGATEYYIRLGRSGGSGTTTVASFKGINEPQKTTVLAVPATVSGVAGTPSIAIWTTINLGAPATASVAAPVPSVKVALGVPKASALIEALAPEIRLPIPVAMSPPAATVLAAAVVPDEVIAPAPNTIPAVAARATASAPIPEVRILQNTSLAAPKAAAGIEMLPPGEYIRLSVPVLAAVGSAPSPRRVGPALSDFAATVVQTEQNWGGASVYYRMSDETTTLTDELGIFHGGWSGTRTLVPGAAVDDADAAMEFNGIDTEAHNSLMPVNNPLQGNGGVYFRGDENPRISGESAVVVFRTLPEATKQMYVFARAFSALAVDVSLRVDNGRLIARWHNGNDWDEIFAGPSVNDGQWHMAVLSTGKPLDDPNNLANLRLYLDGTLQGQLNEPANRWTRALTLGNLTPGGNARWEGALDEYAEYDYTLSRWEVSELWNQLKKLSGPPLRLDVPLATAEAKATAPTIRRSPVRPLNEFYDDFAAPFIDRSRWRDATDNVLAVNGTAVLPADDSRLLTADYFQTKDSSFIVRLDKLPLREGRVFIGLTNEHDIVPDAIYGGPNTFDSFRRHRHIGFEISRYQRDGRTVTDLGFVVFGAESQGWESRGGSVAYVPDDPNHPSPHRWLRLDIDPGRNGGASWFVSPDGINWGDPVYDVHGGKVNAVTEWKMGDNGQMVEEVSYVYEDNSGFFLFDRDELYPTQTEWRGHMRVLIEASGGNKATSAVIDNVNVYPQGSGTPVDILAKPARVQTSTTNEYLIYALAPRVYNSAQDIQISVAGPATASVRFLTPPEPVYVFVPPAQVFGALVAPQRAGDAVPVQIVSVPSSVTARMVTPKTVGEAQPVYVDVPPATAWFGGIPPEVSTDKSSAAPTGKPQSRTITLKTRKVRVSVTQN